MDRMTREEQLLQLQVASIRYEWAKTEPARGPASDSLVKFLDETLREMRALARSQKAVAQKEKAKGPTQP